MSNCLKFSLQFKKITPNGRESLQQLFSFSSSSLLYGDDDRRLSPHNRCGIVVKSPVSQFPFVVHRSLRLARQTNDGPFLSPCHCCSIITPTWLHRLSSLRCRCTRKPFILRAIILSYPLRSRHFSDLCVATVSPSPSS